MLTNGKKVWGIWNGDGFMRDEHGLILVYDDLEVAKVQISGMSRCFDDSKPSPRVISNGSQGQIETKDREFDSEPEDCTMVSAG